MTGIFGGLPSDNIKEVERLYKSVDDALKSKPNTKISDLFCIKTSQGLEFINKHSFQGRWEAFKNRISMLFGGQNRLNLASNLAEATELLTKVSKLDKKFFKEPATTEEYLYKLAHQLIQLHAHAMQSKSLRGKDLKPLSSVKFTMFTEKLPVLSDEQREPTAVAKQLRSAFTNLTEKQALKAAQFLNTYADRGEIFQQLDRLDEQTPPSVVKQQLMPLLQQAILKAISFSSEAETDAFQQIYSKIAPAQAAESSSVTDRNIGMVFGDSFIRGSGLEGDLNSRPYAELMAECLAQESLPQTEKSKALQKVLKNSISLRSEYSLSAKELKTELEKKIASDGRCLILGGWSGHAIVYEIQKQPNGKYSFRVFNEGEGIEYHRQTQDKYRDKVDGCIAFCDIPEDMIFKKAFLGSLQALISLSSTNVGAENPAALLVNHILPMLGGKRETVPPEVQSQLSPQRSGTCTYKSLLAWLANSMSQQEYKIAKIELKLYMLDSYLPTMQKLAKTAIKTECDYNDLRRTYSIISRSIEKFSTSLENLKLVLPSDKIAQAQESILRYKRELPLFEAQILAYEKSMNKQSKLATTSQGPARFAVSNTAQYQPSDRAQGVAASHLLSLAATNLITAIDHTSPEEIVARIANLENIPPEEYTYILDLLIKKVGSVTEWKNINFRDPEQAFANVKKIANYLAKGISKHSAAADYARYFIFTLALETAYNQSGFKPSLGATILDPYAIHTLTTLQCSDPFWVKKIQELFIMSLKSSKLTEATYTNPSSYIGLGEKITDAIISWYNDPQNAAFKDKIQVSVRADREAQKREIAKLIREQEERLAHAKAEVIRLDRTIANFESLKQTPEIVIELITLRNNKDAYTSIIDTHDAIIANIPKLVREDKRYWPWGFLEPSDVDPYLVKDREFIASFLFAKQGFFYDKGFQTDDLMPAHFRSLLAAGAINANIFQKKSTSTSLPEHPNRFMVGTESFPDVIRFKNDPDASFSPDTQNKDRYESSIRNRSLQIIWGEFEKKRFVRMDETNIPEKVDRTQKNGFLYQKEIEYDELTELFSIAASPDIQIDSLLSYMSENQDKFADNDWVNIFHGLLFDRNYLQQAFENPEKKQFLATRMREFFNPLIENAVQLEDFATAANAIWFAKSAQNFLGEPSIITCETIVKVFEQGIAPKFVASRPVLLETILACCKDQFLQPATTEAEQKLLAFGAVANLFSLSNPTGTSSSCIPRMQEARSAAFGLRTAISTGNSDDIYNAFTRYGAPFIAKMQPQLKDASLLQQSDDTFTLRNSQTGASYGKLALSSGTYVPEDKSQLHIYDKELSQEIIQLLKTEDVGLEEIENYRCFIEGDTVHIRDPKTGTELRVLKKDNQIYIATEIDSQKEWLLHLHPKTSFTNHELTHGFHQRLGNNNRFYLVDPKTQKPVFTLQQNGFSNEKHFVSNPPEENFFSRFEDPTCTIFLADNQTNSMQRNAIQEVQFPRLGLTLKMENGKLQLQEQPEWHVAKPEEQFVPHFGPKTGFLVVQNSVGAKRVLIPVWNPTETPEDKKSLNSSYSYEFNGETARKGRFVECSLKNDTITPDSLEARFQLARIYLETGNIDEAEALLFSHTAELTHKKLTDNEIEILTAIATGDTSGDIGSRTLRTRMRALYLLEKNSYQFGKSAIGESNRKKMVDLIEAYLGRLSHLRPLPQAAEYFLLAPLTKDSAKIRLRVSELQPEDEFSNRFEPEVGGAFTILENGVGNIPDKKPTIRTRLRYLTARMGNTFPFDPTTVKSYELEPYMRLIRDEALRYLSKGWDAAIKRGFMQGITVMTQSKDERVKEFALYIYNRVDSATSGRREEISNLRIRQQATAEVQEPESLEVAQIKRNLAPLKSVKAQGDANSFVIDIAGEYFNKEERQIVEATSDNLTLFATNAPEIKDTTTRAKFEQAANDIQAANKQLKETTYTLKDDKDDSTLRDVLRDRLRDAKTALATTEETILQSVASALTSDPTSALSFTASKRTIPTIEELAIVTSKLNYKDFARKLYPELSDIALDQLQEGVKQYLVQKQFVQHLERAIQQVDAVLASRDDADTLRNVLARTLESDRAYDLDAPHASVYLYIETVLNIKMRADQIRNIEKFIAGIEGGKELVLQMIMGAGKTSVLQPILGFLFARPDSLSCVDVPEALFEPVKEGLHKALGNAFRQYVYALPYERENAKDLKFLQTYYDTLLEVQSRGGCLLRTPRVKHSIITSLYEAYYDKDEKRINLIGKIVELLQLNEVVQIDEIDIAMNSKITFKYPVGDAVAVDKTRASMLSNLLLDAATDPELLQVASLDFANAYQTRNNKDFIRKGASLTPELFIDAVRPRLVQLALVRLNEAVENFGQKQAALGDYLTNFLTQSTPFDQEISEKIPLEAQTAILQQKDLSSYEPEWIRLMTEQAAYKSEMNKRVKSTFANQQDIELLGTVADALKNILPAALFKECGSNYGPDPEEGIYVARPYAAPKTPKVSVYADPYEQVIYTTEMVLYYGIPKDAAAKMLKQLQNLAKAEIKNHVALLETDAYKKFQKIMGEDANAFSLLETPPSEAFIDAYTKNASKNKESISEFLQHYVYPQIKTFEDSLLSTPQTLAGSSKLAYGYTGTLHTGILSRTQEACPEEGTDGKTILAIQSKMDKELAETQVYKEQDGKYPDQIIAQMAHDKDLYVFIDSGGWLKEEKIGEFAIRLLAAAKAERPEIEAIVYHNEKGQIVSLEPEFEGSDKLIEVPISSSRFKTTDGHQLTIIQQRYETGTNIPQKPAAKAVLSVRKGMIKREGLQSAFRMRQILYGQSVSYALTEEVKDYIAAGIIDGLLSRPQFRALFSKSGEITDAKIDALDLRHECKDALKNALQRYQTVAEPATMKGRISQFTKCFNALFEPDSVDIWGYKTANEALVEQSKNWDAGKQKMREVIEKPLRMLLADTKIPITTRKKAFELFQEFIIQTKKDSPFTKVTQESKFMSAEDAIEHEIQKHMKLLDLLKKDSEVSKLYYQKLGPDQSIEKQLKSCVKVEDIPAFLETAQSEGGQELEQEVEQEQEQEAQAEQEQEQELQVERVLPDAVQKPYVTIFKDPTIIPQFSTLTTLVGNLPLPDKDRIEFSPNLFIDNAKPDSAAHARYHLPGRYIMVIENPKRYVLVSTQDAAHIQKAIYGYPGTSKITLVSFDGKVVASKTNTPPDDELKRIALQAKIVCGKAGYSKDEIEHIDELLDHDKKKAQELQVFMEKMFSYLPHAAHTYSNSLLRSYFKKKTQVDH